MPRTLVLGCGNPGRCDDGLGPALVARLGDLGLPDVSAEAGFQLNIEDAVAISEHERVVFVDAALSGAEPFEIRKLEPALVIGFSTHRVSAESLLALCEQCFGARPEAWQLAIPGYRWELGEELSPGGRNNLEQALAFLPGWLAEGKGGERDVRDLRVSG